MVRYFHLACYDIRDPVRLRKVHREVAGFAHGGQKSVRECWLDPSSLDAMATAVLDQMDAGADRFLLLRLDPRMRALALGCGTVARNDDLWVVA